MSDAKTISDYCMRIRGSTMLSLTEYVYIIADRTVITADKGRILQYLCHVLSLSVHKL